MDLNAASQPTSQPALEPHGILRCSNAAAAVDRYTKLRTREREGRGPALLQDQRQAQGLANLSVARSEIRLANLSVARSEINKNTMGIALRLVPSLPVLPSILHGAYQPNSLKQCIHITWTQQATCFLQKVPMPPGRATMQQCSWFHRVQKFSKLFQRVWRCSVHSHRFKTFVH